MSLTNLGTCTFDDAAIPAAGKNEFGMDTLTRRLVGARSLLAAFLATLAQGQTYSSGGVNFYLQTWDPDDSTPKATVTLNYKGFRGGGILALIETEIVSSSGGTSANFATENGGKGRIYREEVIYKPFPNQNVIDTTQDVYATGASMEFSYDAAQSTYRYISVGKPNGPRYFVIDISFTPSIKRARATTSDGTTYGSSLPLSIASSLTPAITERVVGFFSKPVVGSPYWECQDVVRQELG